jgi:hypothetical protein
VIAAACLGGDGPTGVADVRLLPAPGATGPAQQVRLSPEERSTAAQAACQYPTAGA